jgi:hypothetical protein
MDASVAVPLEDFDYALLDSPGFKDSVREEIIHPPFLTVGSRKRPINLIPDYLLTVSVLRKSVLVIAFSGLPGLLTRSWFASTGWR